MDTFLKNDPDAAAALKKVGFTYEKGQFYAVDPNSGKVLEGHAAIDAVKTDKHVLSLIIQLLETPEHAKIFADAEWSELQKHAGAVPPDVVKTWPKDVIVMVAHFIHWASATGWPSYAKVGPDIAALCAHRRQTWRFRPEGPRAQRRQDYRRGCRHRS